MNKWMKKLTAALCAAVLMCGMAVTAYAGGGEEWDGLAPVEPLSTETVDPGEGFTEDGNLVTRDLLYDKATNKQFITVQTSGGSTFYIVIDYDKPTDEDGEQYQTYFLNMVDEADLLAAMQAAGGELPECACADKCAVGAINTDCTVCAVFSCRVSSRLMFTPCLGLELFPVAEHATDPAPVGATVAAGAFGRQVGRSTLKVAFFFHKVLIGAVGKSHSSPSLSVSSSSSQGGVSS